MGHYLRGLESHQVGLEHAIWWFYTKISTTIPISKPPPNHKDKVINDKVKMSSYYLRLGEAQFA